jgi:hypothetical protein
LRVFGQYLSSLTWLLSVAAKATVSKLKYLTTANVSDTANIQKNTPVSESFGDYVLKTVSNMLILVYILGYPGI